MKMTRTAHSIPEHRKVKSQLNKLLCLTSTHSKVNLGLESKDGQAEGDPSCDSNCDKNSVNIIECGDGPEHDSFAESEDSQENEIGWELPSDTVTAGHGDEAHQHDPHAGVVHPHVPLDIPTGKKF